MTNIFTPMKKSLLPAALLAIMALAACGPNPRTSDAAQTVSIADSVACDSASIVDTTLTDTVAEKLPQVAPVQAEPVVEELPEPPAPKGPDLQDVRKAYARIIDRTITEYGYFVHDIDGDDVPELFVHTGECEADYTLICYTYADGSTRKLGELGAGHSMFGIFRGKFSQYWMHAGYAFLAYIVYRNGDFEASVGIPETEDLEQFGRQTASFRELAYHEDSDDLKYLIK